MENKKGQVTVFIILGVIIVIVALGVSFVRNENFSQRVRGEVFESVVVPEQAQGVVSFVSNCVQDLTLEGLERIGNQGGYVDFPDISPRTYLQVTENRRLPYWIYSSDNTENIPELNEIEDELEAYVENQFLEECSFDNYRSAGYDIRDGVDIELDIDEEDVKISLNSELVVGIKGNVYDLGDYVFVSVPSRLSEFYEMATQIVERERSNSPLEFNTMNLISVLSKNDNLRIPKIAGMDFECSNAQYNLLEVGEALSSSVSEMTAYLQMEGSNTQTYEDLFYNNEMLIRDAFSRNHRDVDVSFNYYEGWPFELDIKPRRGLSLKSDVMRIPVPLKPDICFNRHNFRYNLRYPIVVDLEAGDEVFSFVMEVFIVDNFGRRNAFGNLVPRATSRSLFCEENQRLSEEVVVSAIDVTDPLDPLEGVRVSYKCGVNECVLGETSEGEYRSKFPNCVGGELILSKEGYGVYREPWDTLDAEFRSITANIEPFRNLNLGFKILDLDSNDQVLGERDLKLNEEVFLQLSRRNDVFGGVDESDGWSYDGSEEVGIDLVPGNYNANIDLVLNEERTLAPQNINGFDADGGIIENILLGHVELEITITENQLENGNVIFKALAIEPLTAGDISRAYEMEDVVNSNEALLQPEFN